MSDLNPEASDEISLIDIAVVIAENWLVLVLAPLIAGVVAFGVLNTITPRLYDSEALLRIDATDAALLRSARVLDPAIVGSTYLEGYSGSLSSARRDILANVLSVNSEPDTDMYRVRVTAETAEDATSLLQRIIDSLIANSTPTRSQARLIEIRLEQAQAAVTELEASLEQLNTLMATAQSQGASSTAMLGDIGQSTVTLVTNIEQRYAQMFELEEQLLGTVSVQDIVQEPTMADSPRERGLLTRVILVVLGVGFLVLVGAFIKSGLQAAGSDPRQIDKVNRIRRAFWLKPLTPLV